MRGLPSHCALLAFVAAAAAPALACAPAFKGAETAESAHYTLAWRALPAAIPVGSHFSVDFIVCPKAGASLPQSLRVDAQMPEHRHGMNYKATVKSEGAGRYRADGLMFHMPGRWELLFELRGEQTERLVAEVILK